MINTGTLYPSLSYFSLYLGDGFYNLCSEKPPGYVKNHADFMGPTYTDIPPIRKKSQEVPGRWQVTDFQVTDLW